MAKGKKTKSAKSSKTKQSEEGGTGHDGPSPPKKVKSRKGKGKQPPDGPPTTPRETSADPITPRKQKLKKQAQDDPVAGTTEQDPVPTPTGDLSSDINNTTEPPQPETEATEKPQPPPPETRKVIKNLWAICCSEIAQERAECNAILESLDLPTLDYSKDKTFPLTDYETAPDLETSTGKDFLDFWVFPVLLPGIQALLQYAKEQRVFQFKLNTLDALDFLVQWLYNNNPRYPLRLEMPTLLEDIPFVREWLHKFPRPPPEKWKTMSRDEAAGIIQRNAKGFLTRIRPDVREMRLFWEELRKEKEERARLMGHPLDGGSGGGRRVHGPGSKMSMEEAALVIQRWVRGHWVRKTPPIAAMRERWAKEKKERQANALLRALEHQVGQDEDTEIEGEGHDHTGHGTHLGGGRLGSDGLPPDFDPLSRLSRGSGDGGDGDTEFDHTHSETCVICAKLREFIQIEEIKAELLAAEAAEDEEDEEEEDEDEEEEGDEDEGGGGDQGISQMSIRTSKSKSSKKKKKKKKGDKSEKSEKGDKKKKKKEKGEKGVKKGEGSEKSSKKQLSEKKSGKSSKKSKKKKK